MHISTDSHYIVYFSRFILKKNGDGGSRRISQILNTINNYNPHFISVAHRDYDNEPVNIPEIKFSNLKFEDIEYKKIITNNDYYYWSENFRNNIAGFSLYAHKWSEVLLSKLQPDIALVDDPIYFAPLIDKLNELKIPVIGIEHNIETHVRGQVEEKYQHELFKKEIEYFKKCDLVITISHEDTIVLNNFGVNTFLLPYYPIQEQYEMFIDIRNARDGETNKRDYILFGTAHNIPTLEGMIELINDWQDSEELNDEKLYIIGFGTEKIKEFIPNLKANVKIMGGVDDETLHDFLKKIKACIIYQSNGTGALTKIIEMLIANVPIYANHHAARSYHNIDGVYEYQNINELIKQIKKDELKNLLPEISVPNKPNYELLLEEIDSILKENSNKAAINDFKKIVQNQSNKIIEVEKEIDLQKTKINNLEDQLNARNNKINNLENELNARNNRINNLENELNARNNRINNLEDQLNDIKAKLLELERINHGFSYRLGKSILSPAIVIKELVKKGLK